MRIEKRTMGWIQKPSAYHYSQQLNAKRKALAQSYLNTQSALSTALFSAQDSYSHDSVEQSLKAVIAKAQAAAKAKIQAGLDQIDDVRKDVLGNSVAKSTSGSDVIDKSA